jgi:hypothetical protein
VASCRIKSAALMKRVLIAARVARIHKLAADKIAISEKIANCGRPLKSLDEALRTALDFLGNPQKLWDSERLEDKRTVLKLVCRSARVCAERGI